MAMSPGLRTRVTEAIGEFLSENEKIETIVKAAIGKDPYNVYTTKGLPRAAQLSQILDKLELDGTERWLLTYVLFQTLTDEKLRKLIVTACPQTLVSLPKLDKQAARVLEMLQTRLHIPLPTELKQKFRSNRNAIEIVSLNITILFAFKSLHECLHQLQLWLTFGTLSEADANEHAPLDAQLCLEEIDKATKQGTAVAKLLVSRLDEKKLELDWIADLEAAAGRVRATIEEGQKTIGSTLRDEVLRLTHRELPRLNKQVLKAADELTLVDLIGTFDEELENDLDQLQFAIRDLKPTVLARALKHKMWQDAENELSLLADLWPAGSITEFCEQWSSVKSRVLWLTQLDPDAESAKRVRKCSDDVDDSLAAVVVNRGSKPSLESYRILTKFWFFTIDAALKSDCSSLRRIDEPLQSILREIDA